MRMTSLDTASRSASDQLSSTEAARPRLRAHPWVAGVWPRLLALLPALLFLPAVLSPPLNHDVAAVLDFSERWLGGERLYADLMDVNPPLIFVLNLIPAAIAAWTPLGSVVALQLCLFAYGLLAWMLSIRVRDRAHEGPAERVLLDGLPALVLMTAGYDFGQREHLMAVGALPYLLCAARRATGDRPRGRIAASVLAGVAFALKPHFLAIPALIECAVILGRIPPDAWSGRRPVWGLARAVRTWVRDPAVWAMAAVWTVYLVSLPILFGDYLNVVVPLVLDHYLELGGTTLWQVLAGRRLICALVLLAPMLWIAFRRPLLTLGLKGEALPRMFALAALGAVASALVQHKGWSYHLVPIEMFAFGLGGLMVARLLDRIGATGSFVCPVHTAAVLGGLMALYAASQGEAPWKQIDYRGSEADGLTQLLLKTAADERVLVLSPGVYPIFPAVNYAHGHSTLRTMNTWLLQGSYMHCLPNGHRYRQVWEMARPEFYVFRTVAEDFARAPPAAVVVDSSPGIPWCGSEFDFIEYFRRHPLFAQVWSHYALSGSFGRYRVYTRKD